MTNRRVFLAGSLALAALPSNSLYGAPRPSDHRFKHLPEYDRYDGVGLAGLVRTGQVSPAELLDAALERVTALNPRINAVVHLAEERARAVVQAGLPQGPFAGVPFLLKDLTVHMKGLPYTAGSLAFAGKVSAFDSTVVERYQRAGLVILGRTTTPELGMTGTTESKLFGATRNPWNLAKTTGGSSGGAAAAVAARIVPMANASDGAGSIRTPASCCGVFGLKPSRGLVPLGPDRSSGWDGLGTVHAITRSVRDSAALLDVSAGGAPGDYYSSAPVAGSFLDEVGREPGRMRIALLRVSPSGTEVHTDCLVAVDDAARLCEQLGHVVEEVTLPVDQDVLRAALLTTLRVAVAQALEDRAQERRRPIDSAEIEAVNWIFYQDGLKVSGLDHARAIQAYEQIARSMAAFMAGCDVILSPTLGQPPEDIGVLGLSPVDMGAFLKAIGRFGPFTALYNVTGQPAMSVPLHWSAAGLPIGVMFAGRVGAEGRLYRLAAQLERARPWLGRSPTL